MSKEKFTLLVAFNDNLLDMDMFKLFFVAFIFISFRK